MQPRSSMELRLKSKDVNFVCELAAVAADNRCRASLFNKQSHITISIIQVVKVQLLTVATVLLKIHTYIFVYYTE